MRIALRAALAAVATAGLVLVAATPASAHNWVVASTPATGSVLTELPEAWELTTNETLLYVGNTEVFGLWARDADGLFYGDGCVDVVNATMSADPVIGPAGEYTLVYALISADGHPLTGEIPFTWEPAADVEPATGTAEATRCGALPEPTPQAADGWSVPVDVWWLLLAAFVVVVVIALTVVLARKPRPDTAPRD
jgi:Uncharacterized protein, homolog of Cu resistance protein CopC